MRIYKGVVSYHARFNLQKVIGYSTWKLKVFTHDELSWLTYVKLPMNVPYKKLTQSYHT